MGEVEEVEEVEGSEEGEEILYWEVLQDGEAASGVRRESSEGPSFSLSSFLRQNDIVLKRRDYRQPFYASVKARKPNYYIPKALKNLQRLYTVQDFLRLRVNRFKRRRLLRRVYFRGKYRGGQPVMNLAAESGKATTSPALVQGGVSTRMLQSFRLKDRYKRKAYRRALWRVQKSPFKLRKFWKQRGRHAQVSRNSRRSLRRERAKLGWRSFLHRHQYRLLWREPGKVDFFRKTAAKQVSSGELAPRSRFLQMSQHSRLLRRFFRSKSKKRIKAKEKKLGKQRKVLAS